MYMQKLQKLSMEFCKKVDNYVTNPTKKQKNNFMEIKRIDKKVSLLLILIFLFH